MTHDEAVDVLQTIKEMYPKYDISKKKVRMLIPQLRPMDYQLVMKNLANYVANHHYAPTISEIAAYPPENNVYLEKMKKWREEASNVPSDLKEQFQQELRKLVEEKKAYERK